MTTTTTARQATTTVKRAIRAAGIDTSAIEVRSRNASSVSGPASSHVFTRDEAVVAALRETPGATKVTPYDGFVSVTF